MSFQTTDPAGARELLDEGGWTYVDVRSVEEFEEGHVPGAYNAPLAFLGRRGMEPNPGFVAAMQRAFPRDARLVLGCKSGGRSHRACELLAQAGYSALANMHGGMHGFSGPGLPPQAGWTSCGFAVTRESAPERTWAALHRSIELPGMRADPPT